MERLQDHLAGPLCNLKYVPSSHQKKWKHLFSSWQSFPIFLLALKAYYSHSYRHYTHCTHKVCASQWFPGPLLMIALRSSHSPMSSSKLIPVFVWKARQGCGHIKARQTLTAESLCSWLTFIPTKPLLAHTAKVTHFWSFHYFYCLLHNPYPSFSLQEKFVTSKAYRILVSLKVYLNSTRSSQDKKETFWKNLCILQEKLMAVQKMPETITKY